MTTGFESSDPPGSFKDFPDIESGRYRPMEKIGAGGCAVVFKAIDTKLYRTVAIKKLRNAESGNGAVRFQREAQLAGSLRHPNIMNVIDFGVTRKSEPYLVLNFVEGEGLDNLIDREGPLPVTDALPLFLQIATGLDYAHKRKVIHRDIKPDNIMIEKKGDKRNALIVDFGLAKDIEKEQHLTGKGVVGTPAYMSPEQIRSQPLDHRSDIYSFGCLMFFTLTGVPPFQADNTLELFNKHLSETPPTLFEATGEAFSALMQETVDRCLSKEAADRYDTTADLIADLERIQSDASLPSSSHYDYPQQERRAGLSTVQKSSIAVVSLVVLGGLLSTYLIVKPEEPTPAQKEFLSTAERLKKVTPRIVSHRQNTHFEVKDADDSFLQTFIEGHSQIDRLQLSRCNISYKSLDLLKDTTIKKLEIDHTALGKDEVNELARLTTLKEFRIASCKPVYYVGFPAFNKNKNLTSLMIFAATFNAEDLKGIGGMKNLDILRLRGCTLADPAVLKGLTGMSALRELNLDSTDIKDEGLDYIAAIPDLQVLNLSFTLVGDRSLKKLEQMKNLKKVYFSRLGGPSSRAIESLRKARPQLSVIQKSPKEGMDVPIQFSY